MVTISMRLLTLRSWLLCFSLMLITLTPAHALTKVQASIDKNPVAVNESFILTVTADDHLGNNALDTSPLLKDFVVGRTSTSSHQQIYNGKSSRTTTWTTLLIARQQGQKTIPALTINNLKTQPISLVVVDKTSANKNAQQQIFITSAVSKKELYVQELLTLTVKLHFSVELQRGSLSEPTLEGANISQIGKDNETEQLINGVRYRVIERVYAISPQQSGTFTLKSPMFSGEISVQSRRRNSYFAFNESKPVSVIGDDINVEVKAIPLNYQGDWLPSELIALHQEWQPEIANFTVGEPITRVLTLTAAGLSEEQLPELTMPVPPGLKIYPDQAETHSRIINGKQVSQKVQKFALVASKAGKYQLPEITIPWWNTVTNKKELATIAAQTVMVKANPDAVEEPSSANNIQAQNSATAQIANQTENQVAATTPASSILKVAVWLLAALVLILMMVCIWLWRKNRHLQALLENAEQIAPNGSAKAIGAKLANNSNSRYQVSEISKACKNDAGEQVLQLLPQWAELYCPHTNNNNNNNQAIVTIDDTIKAVADSDFAALVQQLQQSYFSKDAHAWQGQALAKKLIELEKNFKRLVKQKSNQGVANGLKLNP